MKTILTTPAITTAVLAALIIGAPPLAAAEYTFNQWNAEGIISSTNWSSGEAPSAGNIYTVAGGRIIQATGNTDLVFAGDTLNMTLGILRFFGNKNLTVNDFRIGGTSAIDNTSAGTSVLSGNITHIYTFIPRVTEKISFRTLVNSQLDVAAKISSPDSGYSDIKFRVIIGETDNDGKVDIGYCFGVVRFLNGGNDYVGNTEVINGATLVVGPTGKLGTGDLILKPGMGIGPGSDDDRLRAKTVTLTLENSAAIESGSALKLYGDETQHVMINLNFTGTSLVSSILVNDVQQTGSLAEIAAALSWLEVTGTGYLDTAPAVPEPATTAALSGALVLMIASAAAIAARVRK
ncbi:MAG: hypothetical protein LBK99_07790 [Opitutaceae bacterium]|jgi:hypothetical protein|nr:hypothetical protein [Opitutaceae bacterium]